MNMRKKEILATCILWGLSAGTAFGFEYPSRNIIVHEDGEWGNIMYEQTGSRGVSLYGGDTLTIDDGVTVSVDYNNTDTASGITGGGVLFYIDQGPLPDTAPLGHEDKDLNVSGGSIVVKGQGQDKNGQGAWIKDGVKGKIIIKNTDLDF